MLQLLEEDDCVVGVQYKDKETGDTSKLEIRIQLAAFPAYSWGRFIVVFNYIIAVGLKKLEFFSIPLH